MKTIGSVLKRLLLALGGSASENYLNDITLVDRIAELAENGDINPSALQQYKVGDIFISTSATSPAARFGGTWTQIKDMFLLASGDTYAAGATGGEATHTLTVDEIPSHSHTTMVNTALALSGTAGNVTYAAQNVAGAPTGYTGGGQAHNNMPPYLAVYVWKRIA